MRILVYGACVIDNEGEHATQLLDYITPPFLIAMEDNLRIRLGGEGVPCLNQSLSKSGEIIDLPVEGNDLVPLLIVNGLTSPFQINNGQAAKAKGCCIINKLAGTVGTAMNNHVHHIRQDLLSLLRINQRPTYISGNTTHSNHLSSPELRRNHSKNKSALLYMILFI